MIQISNKENEGAEICGEVSMFDSVRQENQLSPAVWFVSMMVSIFVHTIVICILIILPLILFNSLHQEELLTFLVGPPPAHVQPPAPAPPRVGTSKIPHTITTTDINYAPIQIPEGIRPPSDEPPVEFGIENLIDGIGVPTGRKRGINAAVSDLIVTPLPPLPVPPRPPNRTPIKIGVLQESKCIFKVEPVYPELARLAHISGAVILEATIDEEGNVADVRVLSGPMLLKDAAAQAVKQWKYSPTILNGEPIPILATVTIIFNLR
jgi:periplasmic protein TonB